MPSYITSDGFRIGIPNPETNEEFEERLRNYIFDYVCRKYRESQVGTYEEVMELYNAAHENRRIVQTIELQFDLDLISGNGTELELTPKGKEKCKELHEK